MQRNLTEAPPWCVGYVYLLGTPVQYQKIGFSEQPYRRVQEFTRLPFDVWVEHSFPVGTRNVEVKLHEFFKPRKARGEWFSLGADGIELVKGIEGARSNASLPSIFQAGRYQRGFVPASTLPTWQAMTDAFAASLTRLRVGAGLTHEALSTRCGLPPWTLRNYERGHTPFISWQEVQRLAAGLGVTTDAFRTEVSGG